MKFSKINLLTLVCTGIFALQAQADLVMVACPYPLNQDTDQTRMFVLYGLQGTYQTALTPDYNYTPSAPINTGMTNWGVWQNVSNYNQLQVGTQLDPPQNLRLNCSYSRPIQVAVNSTTWTSTLIAKQVPQFCACTAGIFDILGSEYHFACQTTGCISGGGSNLVSFSNSGMRTAASTLKGLQVPINKLSVGTTPSQPVGVDISTKNVKSASTVFIDAAKKSGIKIISVQEFKAQ